MDPKLQEFNDRTVSVITPVIVIVVILMIAGVIGNPLVIYFFGFKTKPTASYMFIVTLACFDLTTCLISMPLEIVDLVKFYTFENADACRALRFINYFASIASGTVLVAIAVDRFKRICKPFDTQITIQTARIIIVGIITFSAFFSWPSLAIYHIVRVNVSTSHNETIVGFDCTTIRDDDYRRYITAYNIILFFLFASAIVVLIVLYTLVGKTLFKLKSFRFYATKRKAYSSKSQASDIATVSATCVSDNMSKLEEETSKSRSKNIPQISTSGVTFKDKGVLTSHREQNGPNTTDGSFQKTEDVLGADFNDIKLTHETSNNNTQSANKTTGESMQTVGRTTQKERGYSKKRSNKSLKAQNIDTKKYTVITILISIGFILSFLPYLILVTWRTLSSEYEVNLLSDSELVAFQLFLRSFLFSSVCNPIIYGFLNTDFKHMVIRTIKRVFCFWSKPNTMEATSSPEQSAMSRSN